QDVCIVDLLARQRQPAGTDRKDHDLAVLRLNVDFCSVQRRERGLRHRCRRERKGNDKNRKNCFVGFHFIAKAINAFRTQFDANLVPAYCFRLSTMLSISLTCPNVTARATIASLSPILSSGCSDSA